MGARVAWLTSVLAVLALGACGSSDTAAKGPPAVRVCDAAQKAAARALGAPLTTTITNRDRTYIECKLSGRGAGLSILAEASPQAYTAYDTDSSHLAQVYGAAGRAQNAPEVPGLGTVASWFPEEHELLATNATLYRGGSYITVSMTHWSSPPISQLALARAVGHAVLTVAPRGPNPGPPPS